MSDTTKHHDRILAAIQAELWAITPAAMNQIIAIAEGLGDPQALAAKIGQPLSNTRTVTRRNDIAIIPVTGMIFRYANLFSQVSGATSLEVLATDFTTAVNDPSIKGIIQVIDSPGGMAAGNSEYAQMVREATAIKPVKSYISHMGASAAYWMAAGASEIVIADTAILGSIGTIQQGRKNADSDAWEIVSSQSPYKRVDPGTEEGRVQIQAMVDAMAQVFIEAVAKYRNVSVEKVLSDFGKGGVLVGKDAVAAGMADRLGSLEALISEMSSGASGRKPTMGVSMSTQQNNTQTPTKESLKAEHPALYDAIKAEGLAAGATAERERIQAVEAQALPGHEALIVQLKYDGKTTGPEAAVQVLKAERDATATRRDQLRNDAPKPVPHAEAPSGSGSGENANLPLEDRVKAEWDANPATRAEFGSYDTYLAFAKAQESGKVRVIGKK